MSSIRLIRKRGQELTGRRIDSRWRILYERMHRNIKRFNDGPEFITVHKLEDSPCEQWK